MTDFKIPTDWRPGTGVNATVTYYNGNGNYGPFNMEYGVKLGDGELKLVNNELVFTLPDNFEWYGVNFNLPRRTYISYSSWSEGVYIRTPKYVTFTSELFKNNPQNALKDYSFSEYGFYLDYVYGSLEIEFFEDSVTANEVTLTLGTDEGYLSKKELLTFTRQNGTYVFKNRSFKTYFRWFESDQLFEAEIGNDVYNYYKDRITNGNGGYSGYLEYDGDWLHFYFREPYKTFNKSKFAFKILKFEEDTNSYSILDFPGASEDEKNGFILHDTTVINNELVRVSIKNPVGLLTIYFYDSTLSTPIFSRTFDLDDVDFKKDPAKEKSGVKEPKKGNTYPKDKLVRQPAVIYRPKVDEYTYDRIYIFFNQQDGYSRPEYKAKIYLGDRIIGLAEGYHMSQNNCDMPYGCGVFEKLFIFEKVSEGSELEFRVQKEGGIDAFKIKWVGGNQPFSQNDDYPKEVRVWN